MPLILRSEPAQQDMVEIWEHIARDSPAAADALLERFDRSLQLVASLPHAGRRREEFLPFLRSVRVGPYILFYRPTAKGIELVRVFHGARDLPSLFDS